MSLHAVIPESHHVMLWVGNLTEEELQAYLDERGGGLGGQPQSHFAEDLLRHYDHDFVWAKASPKLASVHDLALMIGIQDPGLLDELEKRVPEQISSFIMLWNYRNLEPLTQRFANGKMRFVDSWPQPAPYTDDL